MKTLTFIKIYLLLNLNYLINALSSYSLSYPVSTKKTYNSYSLPLSSSFSKSNINTYSQRYLNSQQYSYELSSNKYSYILSTQPITSPTIIPSIKPSIMQTNVPSIMQTYVPTYNYVKHIKFDTSIDILKNSISDFSELERNIIMKTIAYGFNIDEKYVGWNRTTIPLNNVNKLRLQGQTITITLNIDIALISAFLQFLQNPSVLYNLLISRLNTVLSNGQLNTYLNTAVTTLGATGLLGTSLTNAAYSPMMLTNILVTDFPSSLPSSQPTNIPSNQPLSMPTNQPLNLPTSQPSSQPSSQPLNLPSNQPSSQPSNQPTNQPSYQPSSQPLNLPSNQPLNLPSSQPLNQPSSQPLNQPSSQPSIMPTLQPYLIPSNVPSSQPYSIPSSNPTINTHKPITPYPTSLNDPYSTADATSKNLTIAFLVCVPALLVIYIGSFAYYKYCKGKVADKNIAENNIKSNKVANLEENKEIINIDKIEDNQKEDEEEIRNVESVSSADTK